MPDHSVQGRYAVSPAETASGSPSEPAAVVKARRPADTPRTKDDEILDALAAIADLVRARRPIDADPSSSDDCRPLRVSCLNPLRVERQPSRAGEQSTLAGKTGASQSTRSTSTWSDEISALAHLLRAIRQDLMALERHRELAEIPIRAEPLNPNCFTGPIRAAEATTDTILSAVERIDRAVATPCLGAGTSDTSVRSASGDTTVLSLASVRASIIDAEIIRIVEACNAQDVVFQRLHQAMQRIAEVEVIVDRLAARGCCSSDG